MASRMFFRNSWRASFSYKRQVPTAATTSFPKVPCSVNSEKTILESSYLQHFRFCSTLFPDLTNKEESCASKRKETAEQDDASKEDPGHEDDSSSHPKNDIVSDSDQTGDSGEELELSIDDLVKLVDEKEELLKLKHKEIEKMQDKVLRSYADMENVLERTKREAENSKKFAIQNFAKNLLDVADNITRASSVVKGSFSKLDESKDTTGAVPLLKTLLEGVEMTEKQLEDVFRKFGIEKFDPTGEHFDPHRHHAVFQIPDATKPVGNVAAVWKPGYTLYDRIIRPAEVGVTESLNDDAPDRDSA